MVNSAQGELAAEAAEFAAGEVVALRADPSRVGPVVAVRAGASGHRYSVFFAAGDVREYDGDQLVRTSEPTTVGLEHALAKAQWLDPTEFRALLTAKRLARPENDSLYSLTAARINFIPFQFKPLIRILSSDQHRLFIADEVGVGKTIEAGLILKELDSRSPLENVLIVCPKALTQKWRAEMRRFDEEFEVLTSETLRYCLQETHNDGVWPARYRRAIVHLELLRNEQYLHGKDTKRGARRHGLFTLEPPPAFSMLILDEAHHVRNTETASYALLEFLSQHSDAAVFLSATPVHTGAHNLFALLRLLREDRFLDKATFEQIVEPNRHLVEAVGFIRSKQPENWQHVAAGALAEAAATWWGQTVLAADPRFTSWRDRLLADDPLSDLERIACLRDLEECHTLADVMNRTRRRDIGTTFTLRDPLTVEVDFTAPQRELYELLVDFRRAAVAANHDPQVARLVADMLERQASSCLPVLVPLIEHYVTRGTFDIGSLTDDPEELVDNDYAIGNLPDHVRDIGQKVITAAKLVPADEDPKLDRFLSIVDEVMSEDDGPRKVLGFSFFLRTLAYLEEHLRQRGIRVATISGKVPDDERESLRDRFRLPSEDPQALDVLLSSEVGCEGLDYEFCNRLVNYDLPWNPMRVEQRIGRIDRYGQKSPSVKIFNFITPGTVEERIFFRCYERLGVFRETVGDLDGILGELVQELERTAFSTELTPEQAAEAAQQLADNQLRLVEEQQRLEAHSDALIGLDTRVLGEVDDVVKQHRFVSGDELQTLVGFYFAEHGAPNALSPVADRPGVVRLRLNKDQRAQLRREVGRFSRRDRSTAEFDRWLGGSENDWLVTFDQGVAVEHRSMPFITPVHVLARVAVEELARRAQPLVTSVQVGPGLDEGRYLFSLEAWETIAIRRELRVVPFVVDAQSGESRPDIADELLALLRQGTPPAAESVPTDYSTSARALDRIAAEQRRAELDIVASRNDELIDRRIASLTAFRDSQLRRAEAPTGEGAHELVSRMKRGQRERIEQDFETKTRELESRRDTDIDRQPLAMGVLEIGHAG